MPIVFTLADAAALKLPIQFTIGTTLGIRDEAPFAACLRAAATQIKSRLPEPSHVREQLYSGGFFPMNRDKHVIDRFHRASPEEKWDLVPNLSDQRARDLARWLVGSEWPEVLSSVDRRSIEDEFRDHLMQDKAKWTTVQSALARIDQLSSEATDGDTAILEDYRAHLLKLRDGREFLPSSP